MKIVLLGDPKVDGSEDFMAPYHIGHHGHEDDEPCNTTVVYLDSLAQDIQHEIFMYTNSRPKSLTRISKLISDKCRVFRHDVGHGTLHIGVWPAKGKALHELVINAPQLKTRVFHRGHPMGINKAKRLKAA